MNGYVSIGKPVMNNIIHLLNGSLQHVSNDELGEVYVAGNNVVTGYLSDEHEGSFVMMQTGPEKQEKLYRTRDWGIIHNGSLIYQGITKRG